MGWKVRIVSLCLVGLLCAPASAWAASEQQPLNLPPKQQSTPPTVDAGGMLLKTVIALAFVVLIIWVVYKLMKKLNFRTSSSGGGPAVEVLSRTQLDREMAIYVLRLGSQISVVSKSGNSSAVIRQMSHEEAEQLGLLKSVNPSDQRLKVVLGELKQRLRPSPEGEAQPIDELLAEKPVTVDELMEAPALSVDDLLERDK